MLTNVFQRDFFIFEDRGHFGKILFEMFRSVNVTFDESKQMTISNILNNLVLGQSLFKVSEGAKL